jgi:hypothetical protein
MLSAAPSGERAQVVDGRKLLPATTTCSGSEATPKAGVAAAITTDLWNRYVMLEAEYSIRLLLTMTLTKPSVCAGAVQLISVSEMYTAPMWISPKTHSSRGELTKYSPRTTTAVPPAIGPLPGDKSVIPGNAKKP